MSTGTARRPRPRRRSGRPSVDVRQQHLDWLAMIEVTGPFLSLPVLRAAWPSLDPVERETRDALRNAHAAWRADPGDRELQQGWIGYVLRELLEWDDAVELDPEQLAPLAVDAQRPDFALVEPAEPVKPDTTRVLGMICPPGVVPTALRRGDEDERALAPVDRLAQLCRRHSVELGLATDGRWWSLVWAPVGGVTTVATIDAVSWPEQADRDVVRAFRSLLRRSRFFAVPDDETLVALLRRSLDSQEEVTEALGGQVRRAVELLVDAVGRAEARARERGVDELADVPAQEVYRGAVAVMMRLVFLLFAEERGLLLAENELYRQAYSVGRLCEDLEQAARDSSEEDLEHSSAGWMRLLALFCAVHAGVSHPRLKLPAYDGSIFDPDEFGWLTRLRIDDRTALHMLRAVQYVQIRGERRRLSFRALDVEQIGYVYEGLLSYEGRRAADTVVGLIGKQGLEAEVGLAELEAHAAAAPDPVALGARLAEAYKDSKIGTAAALARRLGPLGEGERAEALRRLLATTGGDLALAKRVLPFVGILRTDLRGLPVVINRDALYVTESRLRKNTGTHYTPRKLAEQVVEGALEPLVYAPGPLQTADAKQWVLKSSEEILALKVADIAMGSGAFLVAACRYLAGKLVEARAREGNLETGLDALDPQSLDVETNPAVIQARREVIEHCLYGVDINPMAVEMAKLSLWLISMDRKRPFTFLDDRLVCGDSLLGITSLEQLEYMHLDPKEGRRLHEGTLLDFTAGVRSLVVEVAEQRRRLARMPGGSLADLAEKRQVLAEVGDQTRRARLYADLVVGGALASTRRGSGSRDPRVREASADEAVRRQGNRYLEAARLAAASDSLGKEQEAYEQATEWLGVDVPDGGFARHPLHWPLVFSEAFEVGGFDAVVGNPPFLMSSKIEPCNGAAYASLMSRHIGKGHVGKIDLVAYFVRRAVALLRDGGLLGQVVTASVMMGATRRATIDSRVELALRLRASLVPTPWPAKSAAIEYCIIDAIRAEHFDRMDSPKGSWNAAGISARRLYANRGKAFLGAKVTGIERFALEANERDSLLLSEPAATSLIRPFLGGRELNESPDLAPVRWVIDFGARPLSELDLFPVCRERVRPEGGGSGRWWQFDRRAAELYSSIASLDEVIAMAEVSRTLMPMLVANDVVFSHKVIVFASADPGLLAALFSAFHYHWATRERGVGKALPGYTASDVFETLPLPDISDGLRSLGNELNVCRRAIMSRGRVGLTRMYNMFHDAGCVHQSIARLRRLHVNIDECVAEAYGWADLDLDHGFHDTRQGVRYTVGPVARQEILDRLLQLNHARYAEEVAKGLHDKKQAKRSAAAQEGLF